MTARRDRGPVLAPGQELVGSPYRIVRLIGEGGMGALYEVEHVHLKKRYVAKTLHGDIRDRPDYKERLVREARALARLSHPNLVEVHHLDSTPDGMLYFVMDKLVGVDLRKMLRSGKQIEFATAMSIGIDVLEALGYAHAEGLVHRDIKPENIFIAQQGAAAVTKVLDFGIARVVDGVRLTGQNFIGTYAYASPEQLLGESITPASDIYSTACLLYEVLAGRGPFDDEKTPRDVGLARIQRAAPNIDTFVKVPRDLVDSLATALARDPTKRQRTATTFAAQLYRIKQNADYVPLAQANTTQEDLVTAVTAMTEAPPSDPAPIALGEADTEKRPPEGMNMTAPMPIALAQPTREEGRIGGARGRAVFANASTNERKAPSERRQPKTDTQIEGVAEARTPSPPNTTSQPISRDARRARARSPWVLALAAAGACLTIGTLTLVVRARSTRAPVAVGIAMAPSVFPAASATPLAASASAEAPSAAIDPVVSVAPAASDIAQAVPPSPPPGVPPAAKALTSAAPRASGHRTTPTAPAEVPTTLEPDVNLFVEQPHRPTEHSSTAH